ncbi:MAG: hypothetical protein QME51_08520 [Planctomycetota bacterium]|nr:hypothetical protein [Planctomycetota bacterium]
MSYVKAGIIYNGKMETYEVHGSELIMSTQKRIKTEMEQTREWFQNTPEKLKQQAAYYKKCLKAPGKYNTGIVHERVKRGVAELDTSKQLKKWVAYLKKMNIPSHADSNEGYPYNSIVDIDNRTFYSMQNNWYASYDKYLPEGWKYKELSIQEMKELDSEYRPKEK